MDKVKRFTGDISEINWSLDKYEFNQMIGFKHRSSKNSSMRMSIGNKFTSPSGSPNKNSSFAGYF